MSDLSPEQAEARRRAIECAEFDVMYFREKHRLLREGSREEDAAEAAYLITVLEYYTMGLRPDGTQDPEIVAQAEEEQELLFPRRTDAAPGA